MGERVAHCAYPVECNALLMVPTGRPLVYGERVWLERDVRDAAGWVDHLVELPMGRPTAADKHITKQMCVAEGAGGRHRLTCLRIGLTLLQVPFSTTTVISFGGAPCAPPTTISASPSVANWALNSSTVTAVSSGKSSTALRSVTGSSQRRTASCPHLAPHSADSSGRGGGGPHRPAALLSS